MRPCGFLLPLLAAALLAGCRGNGPADRGDAQPSPSPASGPGLSIEEATASDLEGPLLVRGYLLVEGQSARLCSGFAESYPPQCAPPSLQVLGYKLLEQRQLYKTQTRGVVTWSDEPIRLLGTIEDGQLTVAANART